MKKIALCAKIILAYITIGCSPSKDSLLLENGDVVSYVIKLERGEVCTNVDEIINRIFAGSNTVDRISSMRLFSDLLLKMDISSLSYADQRRVINEVNESILKISSSLGLSGLSVEEAFCIRIKWLTWQKKQMDRLRPTKRIDISKLSYKQKVVYNEWRACYESLVYSHEMFNRMMEGWSVELELENAPSSIKEEVTRKMEAFLGRKIRTREEAFAAKGELTDSEEMKAVRRGEVGPENLLRDAGPIVIMRSLNQYRRSDDEIARIKKERNEAHRMALYEQNKEAYNLQRRVKTANYNVRRYRCELFSLCGKSIAGCRKMMNDEEFSNFTNQVVRLSNASEKEQKILFQKLNEELRAHNKK